MAEILALTALLAFPCWLVAYRRPELVPLLLFAWVCLTGVLFARFGVGGPSKLLKDILFVLPLYASIFLLRPQLLRGLAVTTTMLVCFSLFAGLTVLQMANPGVASPLVALLGAKIWLLYVPLLLAVGGALSDEAALRRFLRGAVVVSLLVYGVALLQLLLTLTIGYEAAITLFHGGAAKAATQNFANFGQGTFFGRIPATFASSAEFYGFCGIGLAICYAALRFERARRWRLLAIAGLVIGCIAYVTSGSRGALLFIPLLLFATMLLERRAGAGLAVLGLAVPAVLVVAAAIGLNLAGLAQTTAGLARFYSVNLGLAETWQLISEAPLGQGTGSGTLATRYVAEADAFGERKFFEGMYSKAAMEFGIAGPLLMLAVFLSLVGAGLGALGQCRDPRLAGVAAALLAWISVNVAWSLKGWILDLDPTNVVFWIFAGILLRLPSLATAQAPARTPNQHPFLAQLRVEPTILRPPGTRESRL